MPARRVWFSSASQIRYHLFDDCGHVETMNKDNVVDARVNTTKLPPGVKICCRCERIQEERKKYNRVMGFIQKINS